MNQKVAAIHLFAMIESSTHFMNTAKNYYNGKNLPIEWENDSSFPTIDQTRLFVKNRMEVELTHELHIPIMYDFQCEPVAFAYSRILLVEKHVQALKETSIHESATSNEKARQIQTVWVTYYTTLLDWIMV